MNTMLLAVSMRLPPHAMVAHIGRGVTPHCCWQPSMEPLRSKGCAPRNGSQHLSATPTKAARRAGDDSPGGKYAFNEA